MHERHSCVGASRMVISSSMDGKHACNGTAPVQRTR
jgi:hypothetical protein